MMDGFPVSLPQAMGTPANIQENVNEMPPSSEPSSFFSASKDDAFAGGPRGATVVIGVIIALGIIVTASMVIALASASRSNERTTWNAEQPDIAEENVRGGSGLTVIVPEFRAPSTPPPLTTKSTEKASTEGASTEGENTEESTEVPFTAPETLNPKPTTTTLPTTRAKKDTWVGLICTLGTKLSSPQMIPKDNLCNYLFYDSVFKNGSTPFYPGHLDSALSIFLDRRSAFKYTGIGIGFAYKYRQHLKSELSTKDGATPMVLKHFFDQKICNFGILDTPTEGFDKSSLEEMLESLKLVDGFVKSKGAWPKKCSTFVAVPTPDKNLENVYLEIFPKIFTPSVVVILSHYVEGDNTVQDCRVVPPTLLTRPVSLTTNSHYRFDLNTAAESIEKLIARGMDATWALSVTMKGRWTKLKAGQPVDFLSECEHDPSAEPFGRYNEVCEDPSFSNVAEYKSGVRGALFYNKKDGRILSFDNNTNVVQKLCRLRAQHLAFAYGIVGYDVDYDDYSGVCVSLNAFGRFTLVYTLTYVRDFVEDVFDIPKEFPGCLKQSS